MKLVKEAEVQAHGARKPRYGVCASCPPQGKGCCVRCCDETDKAYVCRGTGGGAGGPVDPRVGMLLDAVGAAVTPHRAPHPS